MSDSIKTSFLSSRLLKTFCLFLFIQGCSFFGGDEEEAGEEAGVARRRRPSARAGRSSARVTVEPTAMRAVLTPQTGARGTAERPWFDLRGLSRHEQW